MAFFNEFPHTRFYDADLGWIITKIRSLLEEYASISDWRATHEFEYEVLKDKVDGIIGHLSDIIVPWDSSIAYQIYSIVEYQGQNYIAIQDVPVGAMITNTDYWQPANTIVEQINAISVNTSNIEKKMYYVMPEDFGAVGDGVSDDYGAFLLMVADAAENNKTVALKPDTTYFLGSVLTMESPVNIEGNGATLKATHGGDILVIGTGVHPIIANNADISGILFDCGGLCNALNITSLWGASFRNIKVANPSAYGIKMGLCYGCTFDQILIQNSQKIGLYLSYVQGTSHQFGNNGNTFNNISVDHYNLDGSGAAGIHIDQGAGNTFNSPIVEFGNETTQNGIGIYMTGGNGDVFNSPWLEANYIHVVNAGSNGEVFNGGHWTAYGNQTAAFCHTTNSGRTFFYGIYIQRGDLVSYLDKQTYFISEDGSYQVIITFTQFIMTGHILLGLEDAAHTSIVDATRAVRNQHNAGLAFSTVVGGRNEVNIMFGASQPLIIDQSTYKDGDDGYPAVQHNNYWGNKSFEMPLQPVMRTYATNRPGNAPIGGMCYDQSLHKPIWYDGTSWRTADGVVL